jgi:hypothetical protein
MSPLPDELRTALHRRADEITAPPDPFDTIEARATRMRRQRIALGTIGTASVTAVVVAIALVVAGGGTAKLHTGQPLDSGGPTPSASVSLPPGYQPINLLGWAARGDAADGADPATKTQVMQMLGDATAQWSSHHSLKRFDTGTRLLWSGMLPDGRRALVFQAWTYTPGVENSANDAWTVYYAAQPDVSASDAAAGATLVTTPTWYYSQEPGAPVSALKDEVGRLAELSGGLLGPDGGYAIVLAKHTDDSVDLLSSSSAYNSALTIDGVAVIQIQPGDNPVIEVRDASGAVTYHGPLEIMGQTQAAGSSPAAP